MKDMRMQARGLILYKDFDSAIIGTSMLENTSAKEANKKLGGNWINLSLGGSTFALRAVILDYLFKHKDIKNIIYSLDIRALNELKPPKTKTLFHSTMIKLLIYLNYISQVVLLIVLYFFQKKKNV
ncbi:hypothetical protein OLS52_08485 [Campylobacter jejuni]|nr:hypothetical protein [Campylobacter jejuni]MCW1652818.1 hypothetical protein [Campylobacter jejuni]